MQRVIVFFVKIRALLELMELFCFFEESYVLLQSQQLCMSAMISRLLMLRHTGLGQGGFCVAQHKTNAIVLCLAEVHVCVVAH